jgi:NADP-dependent 3-hydroxy acid dehydrogenase YdfG
LVKALASKYTDLDITIFAGVRNPDKAVALQDLAKQYPGKILITSYDASDKESTNSAAQVVESKYGYVDIVIANAGKEDSIEPLSPSEICPSCFWDSSSSRSVYR